MPGHCAAELIDAVIRALQAWIPNPNPCRIDLSRFSGLAAVKSASSRVGARFSWTQETKPVSAAVDDPTRAEHALLKFSGTVRIGSL